MNIRLGTKDDIDGVLALQDKYLYAKLSEEERKEGFVTTPFTIPQIEEAIEFDGLYIAVNENEEVIAYAYAADWTYFKQWEMFRFMISEFPGYSYKGQSITTENTFQYGPVCVDKAYRGKGLVYEIFEAIRLDWRERFPICITFIGKINAISEKVHIQKMGWEIIKEFQYNGKDYLELAYDMEKPAI